MANAFSSKTKRLTVQSLLIVAMAGLGITAVLSQVQQDNIAVGAQVVPADQPSSEALDLQLYTNVMLLRRRTNLKDIDLAAMGMTQGECEAVLERLVSWSEKNENALRMAERALYNAERELEEQSWLVRIGQASADQLRDVGGKANAVARARSARQALMHSGAEYAMQGALGKTVAWKRASAIKGEMPTGLRYISTMSEDRLNRVRSEAKQKKIELEQALSRTERRELKAARDRINSQIASVRAAELVAMPLPTELSADAQELDSEE